MASVSVAAERIRAFRSEAAFERWIRRYHEREAEVWLRIYKKGTGIATVTYAEALDVALCWGWIDGIRKGYDEASFLQRFTPRRPKSIWSQVNRDNVARLTAAGRMTVYGQRRVDEAKSDGRWDAAYAPARSVSIDSLPSDLRAAIEADRRAAKALRALGAQDIFALAFRTQHMKTQQGRARKIAEFVERLARGESIAARSSAASTGRSNPSRSGKAMTAYAALLRAVNVGGTGKLPMNELRALCEASGFERVSTYIQSGNVVFTSPLGAARVKRTLEHAIEQKLGRPHCVLLRTASEMRATLEANPFIDAAPNRVLVLFLDAPPPKASVDAVAPPAREELALIGRELFIHFPDGMGKSKLKVPFAASGTGRNLNTVARLVELMEALV